MSKKTYVNSMVDPVEFRQRTKAVLIMKYFNLFMNKYKFVGENITDEMSYYILKKLWHLGSIACFKVVDGSNTDGINKYENGVVAFCPFAVNQYNIYDYPVFVNLLNTRGVNFIPARKMVVDKDVVIGWAQRNHKGIYSIVEWYIDKIVDVEMTLRNQLASHKFAWVFKTSPENETAMRKLAENLMGDVPVVYGSFIDENGLTNTDTFQSSNNYIIDKLYMYKSKLENELLTFLGVNNTGDTEKKEHLIGDEVNANNEETEFYGDVVFDNLKEFCGRVNDVLGYNLDVLVKEPQKVELEEKEEDEDESMSDDETTKN